MFRSIFLSLFTLLLFSSCHDTTRTVGAGIPPPCLADGEAPSFVVSLPPVVVTDCVTDGTKQDSLPLEAASLELERWPNKPYLYQLIEDERSKALEAQVHLICLANDLLFAYKVMLAKPVGDTPPTVAYIWPNGNIRVGLDFYEKVQDDYVTLAWVLCHELGHALQRQHPEYFFRGEQPADAAFQHLYDKYNAHQRREIGADFLASLLFLEMGYTLEDMERSIVKVGNAYGSSPCDKKDGSHPCGAERIYALNWYVTIYLPMLPRD